MKKLILAFITLALIAGSCFLKPLLTPEELKECLLQHPSWDEAICQYSPCMTPPYVLLGLDKMLEDVSSTLKAQGVDFWLEGGTLLGAYRFQAIMPFDDDVDIQVFDWEFEGNIDALVTNFSKQGYSLRKREELSGLWQVHLTEPKFLELINSLDSLSEEQKKEAKEQGHGPIWLDIFPMEKNGDTVKYVADWSSGEWPISQICDWNLSAGKCTFTKTLPIFDNNYPVPQDMEKFLEIAYGDSQVLTNIIVNSMHSSRCSDYKVYVEDLCEEPKWSDFFKEKLADVFGSSFKGFSQKLIETCSQD